MLWLVLQVPIQQGRHPPPRVWGHRYQRGVTGIINFLATLSAFRYFPFKIRKFRKKQKSVIELASLSVSSVSYLLGMNTKKAVHRNRKGNHWNSNMKLKKKTTGWWCFCWNQPIPWALDISGALWNQPIQWTLDISGALSHDRELFPDLAAFERDMWLITESLRKGTMRFWF